MLYGELLYGIQLLHKSKGRVRYCLKESLTDFDIQLLLVIDTSEGVQFMKTLKIFQ